MNVCATEQERSSQCFIAKFHTVNEYMIPRSAGFACFCVCFICRVGFCLSDIDNIPELSRDDDDEEDDEEVNREKNAHDQKEE